MCASNDPAASIKADARSSWLLVLLASVVARIMSHPIFPDGESDGVELVNLEAWDMRSVWRHD